MAQDQLFSDLLVLDVGTWIAAPVATTMLADFGARVIKVELPGAGDQYRTLSGFPNTPTADSNYMWQMDARNKESLTLNLKSPAGKEILEKLIAKADIYVTNHPLPMRRTLGLDYESIAEINPAIIYASLTAYGEQGPDKDKEGFDLTAYWARSGLMDLVRASDARPAMAVPGMGDHPSAVSLYASITTALIKRMKTGEGSMVHTSLLANGLWSASCIAAAGFVNGSYESYRDRLSQHHFATGLYQTEDDRWLQITMVRSEAELDRFFKVIGAPTVMTDNRFDTTEKRIENSHALFILTQSAIRTKTSTQWVSLFAEQSLNVIRMTNIEEVSDDPMVTANNMVKDMIGGGRVIRHPVNVDGLSENAHTEAPEVGQDNESILTELGFSAEDITKLSTEKAI